MNKCLGRFGITLTNDLDGARDTLPKPVVVVLYLSSICHFGFRR